jgi:hypothetical protein
MPFPKFGGTDLVIWIIQCEDYFNFYRVPDFLKSMVASLNFEGTAARWLQVVRLKQGLGDWRNLSRLVLEKFGVEEYPRAMRRLMSIRQKGGVVEYGKEFEELRYATTVHNHVCPSMLLSLSEG